MLTMWKFTHVFPEMRRSLSKIEVEFSLNLVLGISDTL